jgi:hypothetical protein
LFVVIHSLADVFVELATFLASAICNSSDGCAVVSWLSWIGWFVRVGNALVGGCFPKTNVHWACGGNGSFVALNDWSGWLWYATSSYLDTSIEWALIEFWSLEGWAGWQWLSWVGGMLFVALNSFGWVPHAFVCWA